MGRELKSIILAAGKGTRLRTEGCDLPKVMRQVCGKPLLHYVLSGLRFIDPADIVVVVGYKKEKVMEAFSGYTFVEQKEQLGTGHAVMSAEEEFAGYDGDVLVCCGDMPLLTEDTYSATAEEHRKSANACTILTGTANGSLPYGRIIRDEKGNYVKTVEEKDCTEDQLAIRELNSGVYVFDARILFDALHEINNNNNQGEYYLTDVPPIIAEKGGKIGVCMRELGDEIIGVNTVEQLKQVEKILLRGK